jgi:hypothetical protein
MLAGHSQVIEDGQLGPADELVDVINIGAGLITGNGVPGNIPLTRNPSTISWLIVSKCNS